MEAAAKREDARIVCTSHRQPSCSPIILTDRNFARYKNESKRASPLGLRRVKFVRQQLFLTAAAQGINRLRFLSRQRRFCSGNS